MKKLTIYIFLLSSLAIFAQGEANNWFFGQNTGINFNGGTASPITGNLNTNEGCASFSDKNGNLLFYTDGITVWDKNNNIMPNGKNLLGDPSSTQSAIIVPHPGNSDLFYIFTVGANDYDRDGILIKATEGLHYYSVDMSLNGGLGNITGPAIDLSIGKNAEWTEKVTSVKGADCNTFWIISLVNNTFISYKIDSTGLINSPISSLVNFNAQDPRGYLKASPDGKRIASATYGQGKLYLYSFDDTSGVVSNDGISLIVNPENDGYGYGIEFSPNSSKLYCSTYDGESINKLFQFNLDNPSIISSKYLVNSQVGFRGGLQLAPNGKIYATVPESYSIGTHFLNTINFPDALGVNCDFELNALNLGSGRAMQGLPPFIASLLIPVEITDGFSTQNLTNTVAKRCIGENYQLSAENIEGSPTYKWTFNSNVVSTIATLDLPNLSNTDTGTYFFEAETIDDCGFKLFYKGEVNLEVYEPPTIAKPSDIKQCDDDNDGFYNFDLNFLRDIEVLNGQDETVFEVIYFKNLIDADNNENEISMPYTNSTAFSTETLIARIQNIQNPICYKTESFTLQIFELPNPPAIINNLSKCDTNIVGTDVDGIEIFNLTEKEIEILNGQEKSDFTISYYREAALTNQIVNPSDFQNTVIGTQTIYVEIVNNYQASCSFATSFILEVFSLPAINSSFLFKQCDEDGISDGITDFNLEEANEFLTLGDTSLTVTYFLSLANAENSFSPIISSPFSNNIQSTVFARIENSNGCHRVALVDLLVSSTHFPADFLKTVTHCDDDADFDGLNAFDLNLNSPEIIDLFPTGQNLSVSYYRNLSDAQLEENEIASAPYLSQTPFNQLIYIRVESDDNGECFGLGPYLNLVVNGRPEFELAESAIYCQNLPPITVSIYNATGDFTYKWTNESGVEISNEPFAIIDNKGAYTVVATTEEGCESFPKQITIDDSIIANITENAIDIIDDSVINSITINTTNLGIGDYEFALDDSNGFYQDEPSFNYVSSGIHTVFIRDKNECGISQIDVSVIGFPNFFTPNNDGHNDTWQILGVNEDFYSSSTIYVFDRFGKIITKIEPSGNGWNGFFNGEQLPATDYWFTAELTDNLGNTRLRKGHFSLIR